MLDHIFRSFTTRTRSLEAFFVLEGLKRVSRMSVLDRDLPAALRFCNDNSLEISRSDFKVSMEFNSFYSTKGIRLESGSKAPGYFFIYISKNPGDAERAKSYENNNEFKRFGRILGYPECCIDFFIKHKPEESKEKNDYVIPALKNSEGFRFPFLNNIFGRYFDTILVSHSPCSFSCPETRAMAERNLRAIEKYDPDYALSIERFIKSAALYSEDNVILLQGSLKDRRFSYSRLVSLQSNFMYAVLKNNKSFRITKKDAIRSGDQEFKAIPLVFE